jgi:hypothetical protein
MAAVDSQVLQAISAISSWEECSNTNYREIDRLAMPHKWYCEHACVALPRKGTNSSNAAEHKQDHLRSRFGGVLEEQVSNLAGHFWYLAVLLDVYDKHLIILSRNCSFQTLVFLAEYRENTTWQPLSQRSNCCRSDPGSASGGTFQCMQFLPFCNYFFTCST